MKSKTKLLLYNTSFSGNTQLTRTFNNIKLIQEMCSKRRSVELQENFTTFTLKRYAIRGNLVTTHKKALTRTFRGGYISSGTINTNFYDKNLTNQEFALI